MYFTQVDKISGWELLTDPVTGEDLPGWDTLEDAIEADEGRGYNADRRIVDDAGTVVAACGPRGEWETDPRSIYLAS